MAVDEFGQAANSSNRVKSRCVECAWARALRVHDQNIQLRVRVSSGLLDCVFVYIVLYQLKSVVFGIFNRSWINLNVMWARLK